MATMTVVDDVESNNQPAVTAGYTISIANTTPQASSSDNGQKISSGKEKGKMQAYKLIPLRQNAVSSNSDHGTTVEIRRRIHIGNICGAAWQAAKATAMKTHEGEEA